MNNLTDLPEIKLATLNDPEHENDLNTINKNIQKAEQIEKRKEKLTKLMDEYKPFDEELLVDPGDLEGSYKSVLGLKTSVDYLFLIIKESIKIRDETLKLTKNVDEHLKQAEAKAKLNKSNKHDSSSDSDSSSDIEKDYLL